MTSDRHLALMALMGEIEQPTKAFNRSVRLAAALETESPQWDAAVGKGKAALDLIEQAVRRWVTAHPASDSGELVIAASEIELDGGDVMLQELSVGDPIEIDKQTGPLSPGIWVIAGFECERRCRARVRRLTAEEIRAARQREATARIYE